MSLLIPLILLALITFAQDVATPRNSVQRQIRGQTLVSKELPAAELTFDEDYRYVGGQTVNLYGNADAEQHVFAKASGKGSVERFYWVQFEHFLPSNTMTYQYPFDRTTDVGDLRFIYDVKSFTDYDAMQAEDPRSDGAAIRKLLAQQNLSFPKKAARVRMFYFPTPDRRTELMIIYGEALTEDSNVPVAAEGHALDSGAPDIAMQLLKHAQTGLSIRKR